MATATTIAIMAAAANLGLEVFQLHSHHVVFLVAVVLLFFIINVLCSVEKFVVEELSSTAAK